ncbi:PREDICTED: PLASMODESMATA CALLOSE-BINDING PROTEIN 3-like [Ipomoea nil]|uniref:PLASMODESMATA CALLOSE-BINDING PROTEIN 3-like n=1 Tax=Ipomoea nil TaxID=35883 RepID=UPI0009019799|nr:PREDICTED: PLASMODESMATA CALLOSE-BINDING PROTEIN 3-like [Ipomoea nil]
MMAVFVLSLVLLFALAGHSSAMYCLCKDGSSVAQLQKNIDFSCGSGADCSAILQNGACFNPNTVKDHCNYAVNSYYQRQSQSGANCDFFGTATLSDKPPGSVPGSCVYQSTPGNTGGSTGTGNGTPTNPGIINNTPFGFGPGPTGVGINPDGSAAATHHKHYAALFTLTLVFSSLICLRD